MIAYLCSCGFAAGDPDWFDGHTDEHADHGQHPRGARRAHAPGMCCYQRGSLADAACSVL